MATNLESDFPSSPRNDESDAEDQEEPIDDDQEPDEPVDEQPEEEDIKPAINNNVADILKRLQSSGALIKVPKQEYRCNTCDEDFLNWEELENHLIQHVSLPSLVLDKLPSDEEDNVPSGDDNWSDEEEEAPSPPKPSSQKTPKKIDISQILNKTGLSIKKPGEGKETSNANSTLNKLSGLGFTIKKNSTPIKKEKPDQDQQSNKDVMQKLGQLGGIKLKLKSDGNKANTFKVVNGLKDFKASDDEDEKDGETDDEQNKSAEHDDSDDEHNAHNSSKNSESDESDKMPTVNKKNIKTKTVPEKPVIPKVEKEKIPVKTPVVKTPVKPPAKAPVSHSALKQVLISGPPPRPSVKLTPKRGSIPSLVTTEEKPHVKENSTQGSEISTTSTPERRESRDATTENVVIKKEVDAGTESASSNVPLFSGQIKSERTTPPLSDLGTTPAIATIKTEPDPTPNSSQPLFVSQSPSISTSASTVVTTTSTTSITTPLLPVTKTEDTGMTVIEINGDSNDEDDDCCVVSATPAPDIKPVIPKTESQLPSFSLSNSYSTSQPSSFSSSQPSYSSSSLLSSRMPSTPSTEKQHSFNWNAPDSKPAIDILEKSTDDMLFERLLSSDKKESLSISDASEYVSLDSLGPQHSCEVCNTRFTNILHLEEHKRVSGHSMSLVAPSSANLLPYNPSSNILSSLLPVKQLAEQVGKLSAIGNTGSGFTHQQNVMINIQAYPGGGGVMVPPYNNYSGQNMHSGYQQTTTDNMYSSGLSGLSAQTMPGQYPGQSYIGGQSGYSQQYQQSMSKPTYPGTMPHNSYDTVSTSSPYSTASPLQSMQQAVYGQSPASLINTQQMGPMGAPISSVHPYASAASPSGTMKPPTSTTSGIKIQNVQTFAPGQLISAPVAQVQPGPQMNTPSPIRMASGANVTGPRPRMPSVRGGRPSIRPGIQVQGQVRGAKPGGPRMPLKRPAGAMAGPGQKRRPDMLLPGKHDNEDCQVMAMQKQRDGLPMIQSVQGAKDKLNLSQISITKKTVNKEANAMANVLASRGISIKQKQKSRSPSPERPVPHIPNLGAGVSIKHTSKSSNFSIPEAKVGGGMVSCKICRKMFMNHNSLSVHMAAAHPQSKLPVFKCDECPASYPKSLQLQHHKRVFHNVTGPNRELGLPVVDLSQEDNLKRLSSLGIYSFIPLANREQASGSFGIPVISVHNMQNGITNSLKALGADGLLSLGPLKPLPNT